MPFADKAISILLGMSPLRLPFNPAGVFCGWCCHTSCDSFSFSYRLLLRQIIAFAECRSGFLPGFLQVSGRSTFCPFCAQHFPSASATSARPLHSRPSPHALSQPGRLHLPTWVLSVQSPWPCTHTHRQTQTSASTQTSFLTNQLLHNPAFAQTNFCKPAFARSSFYTHQLLHKPASRQTTFYANHLFTNKL